MWKGAFGKVKTSINSVQKRGTTVLLNLQRTRLLRVVLHRFGGFAGAVTLALADNRGTEPAAKIIRQFVKVRFPIDLDSHFGCIADDVAVVAPLKMIFQLSFGLGVHRPVEVVG